MSDKAWKRRKQRWTERKRNPPLLKYDTRLDGEPLAPMALGTIQCTFCHAMTHETLAVRGKQSLMTNDWIVRNRQIHDNWISHSKSLIACPKCAHKIPHEHRTDLVSVC
jgi:hypothetical protein